MGIPEDLDIALERIIMYEIGPDHDVQRRFHAGISAAVHKIPTTGKIHTQPVLRVCPDLCAIPPAIQEFLQVVP